MVFVQLSEFVERKQQLQFIELAEQFVCRDADVEAFLKTSALENEIRHRSRTYLFLDNNAKHILAYFTLALKTLSIEASVSNSIRKRLDGFSKNTTSIASILIGQFGKDLINAVDESGSVFLNLCISIVSNIRKAIGGRFVWLECLPIKQVVEFYERNGFRYLQADSSDLYQQMFLIL